MRFQLTAVLLLLNLALAGVVVFVQQREADRAERRDSRLVLPAGAADLARVAVVPGPGSGVEGWVLERGREGWRLAEPVAWPANEHAVSRIVTTLEFLEKQAAFGLDEVEASGRGLDDYGLSPPTFELVLTGASGRETRLGVGRPKRGAEGRLYLLDEAAGEIGVVGPEFGEAIGTPLAQLRAAEVFRIPRFEVRSLGLQLSGNGNLRVRFERGGEGWSLVAPIQAVADTQAIEQALGRLLAMQVESFGLPEGAAPAASPLMQVVLEGTGRRVALVVLGPSPVPARDGTPAYVARLEDSGEPFVVAAAPLDALADAQERLRERRFVRLDAERLRGIAVRTPARTVSLKRLEDASRWQVVQEGADGLVPRDAEPAVVEDLVRMLDGLEATAFVSDAPSASDLARYGLAETATSVLLEGPTPRELRLGDPVEGRTTVFAMMAGEPFVYEVPASVLGRVKVRSLDYRRRVVAELPAAARLARLRLLPLGGGEPVLDVDPAALPEDWAEGRRAAFAALESAGRGMPVRSFLGRGVAKEGVDLGDRVEPWAWELVVDAALPAGEGETLAERRVLFTRRLGGTTQFGAETGADLTFLLTDAIIDALFVFTGDRAPPVVPPAVVEVDPEAATRPGRVGDGTGLPEGVPAPRPPAPSGGEPEAVPTP